MRPTVVAPDVVSAHLAVHPDWSLAANGHLMRTLRTAEYATAVAIVASQIEDAEALDHHPIITLGVREVTFELWTHDQGGLTSLDLEYITRFDAMLDRYFSGRITT